MCSAGDMDVLEDPAHLRRLPMYGRVDLRAERSVELGGWPMRVYVEMQNASLTREVIGYQLVAVPSATLQFAVEERTLFIPLPIVGLEADL
jgi:hypothetical protein